MSLQFASTVQIIKNPGVANSVVGFLADDEVVGAKLLTALPFTAKFQLSDGSMQFSFIERVIVWIKTMNDWRPAVAFIKNIYWNTYKPFVNKNGEWE
jgi:hypothetical protein